MHGPLVTLLLALMLLLSSCTGYVNPITGTTLSGGVPATQSRLLNVRLPSGMECIPDHCKIDGSDGLEIVRGDASPALCAQVITTGMQDQGWTLRLATAANLRACYVYDNGSRTAAITIEPQTGTSLTLVTIATSSGTPSGTPLPVAPARKNPFDFGGGSNSNDSGSMNSSDSSGSLNTAPLSTAPESGSGSPIVGRDI